MGRPGSFAVLPRVRGEDTSCHPCKQIRKTQRTRTRGRGAHRCAGERQERTTTEPGDKLYN